ncbi:MAG: undecaprenyl-phosphate glucose phosphotransferase [Ignavibacteriaceae bacterium]|jgi:putative colanic acid biosynthesis UDP-glucose lipid carrier transferase|nr:undecaprenyl-phosphate glucose phosphotransferase [Ignavibacteriaceae bacterium]
MFVNKDSIYHFRLIFDFLFIAVSFLIAAIAAQSFVILLSRDYMFALLLILGFVWSFTANAIGFYEDTGSQNFSFQFIGTIKQVSAQVMFAILFIFISKENLFTRNFILYYGFNLLFFISLRIISFRLVVNYLRKKGKNVRNLIIIGAGEVGQNFWQMLGKNNQLGYHFLGFVGEQSTASGINCLGTLDQLTQIIQIHHVEEAIIALPEEAARSLDSVIKICNINAIRIHIIPDYFRFVSKKFKITMLDKFPIITVRDEPLQEIQWRIVKRVFDILLSLIVIFLITSWLFPILMIIHKFSSRGKIFYIQDRIGKNNKVFKCYKFRTMYENFDDKKFIPTTVDDLRITRFGKFLRRSNLDELPQVFNVLLGEMSIVGPRPHAIAYNELYKEFFDEIKLRSLVKPGITGWAQVHGLRGDVPDEEKNKERTRKRIEYDIWYIENWSIWLDIQIILLTLWQMIKADTKGI